MESKLYPQFYPIFERKFLFQLKYKDQFELLQVEPSFWSEIGQKLVHFATAFLL